jgi:hypothetical protein
MNLSTSNIDDFSYTMEEISFDKTVGSGSYGEVWLAKARGQTVAVKKFFTRDLKGEHVDSFCSEASLMWSAGFSCCSHSMFLIDNVTANLVTRMLSISRVR